ncbi:hypothetical protein AbraIFM66951_010957 [Aspergillus brasiliensis]|uniref:Uncharacterized protein n=1 Tax=Aspergillus brasiliensis TaxID=319629 RepID=A0A9W5YUR8_9EURO|nr:hypothetical protein AbraCBS73388_010956 [Aspergillus brasiliensis]GKZ41676.1 hypothetical protein AbraIFM66951_010957 [Aspergillus brasiliensis]
MLFNYSKTRLVQLFTTKPSRHSLQNIATSLQSAVSRSRVTNGNYENVEIFALRLEEDGDGVAGLQTELLDLFSRVYGYNCEAYVIPTGYSGHGDVWMKIDDWSSPRERKNTLRIYIYTGIRFARGPIQPDLDIEFREIFDLSTFDPRLPFSCANNEGDSLCLVDCWNRRPVPKGDGPEVIASCALEQKGKPDSEFGLTRLLLDALKANDGAPITAATLYARLFRNASQSQIQAYLMHAPDENRPSITLKPLNRTDLRPCPLSSERVLFSVEVEDNVNERDVKAWEEQLLGSIPHDVLNADIKVERTFQSNGIFAVLLITVPLEIWTMLPDDPAYKFVSHVTSNNESSAVRALPFRQRADIG